MKLIELHSLLQTGQITEEQAAAVLNMNMRDYRIRVSKWGLRLPLLFSILDAIREGVITRGQAAEALGVQVRNVNKLTVSWNIVRPVAKTAINETVSQVKWEVRKKFAIDYIADGCTLHDAADSAGVSDRQMRRWISELLMKHFDMPWKDLAKVTTNRRKRLAEEIETAENMEIAKQNTINAIARGDKTLQDVALERVLSKRTRRTANSTHVR